MRYIPHHQQIGKQILKDTIFYPQVSYYRSGDDDKHEAVALTGSWARGRRRIPQEPVDSRE